MNKSARTSPVQTLSPPGLKHCTKGSHPLPGDPPSAANSQEEESVKSLTSLKRILQQCPKDRCHNSVISLMDFTKDIKFFRDVVREQNEDAHFQCCQHMKYEFIRANHVSATQYVFHKGDPGTKFYVILEGRCAVLVPQFLDSGEMEYKEVTEYGPGDCFGELALFRNSHRTAGVVCRTDAHFAVLEQDDFARIIGKVKESILEEKVAFLSQFPFFSSWPKGEMLRISYYFKEQTYTRKQAVYRYGDDATSIYFIKEGEFQIFENILTAKSSPTLKTTKVKSHFVEFTLLSKNQLFGEEDIIVGEKTRTYSVSCHSATGLLLVIAKEVRGMQDFLTRVSSEHALEYLNKMNSQKTKFRKSRLAALSNVEKLKNLRSEWNLPDAADKSNSKKVLLPTLPRILSPVGSLERDLRLFSIGHLGESPELCSPRTEVTSVEPRFDRDNSFRDLPEPLHTDRPRPSWDFLLRRRRAERERRPVHRLPCKPIVNIHTHKLHAVRCSLKEKAAVLDSDRRATFNIVVPLDALKLRSSERELYL